ncbi:hypothetical protein V3C99_009441 [Haemonchus contortus]
MSFEFKIPGSFLKKKAEQEQLGDGNAKPTEPPSLFKRQFPSSRLFGNLTRGGPISVQNPIRAEGALQSRVQKPRDRRFADWLNSESGSDSTHKLAQPKSDGEGGSVSRFKLVRNVEKNVKPSNRTTNPAGSSGENVPRSSSIFRKRSSTSLASAAAIKRATKLVRAKRSTSREEVSDKDQSVGSVKFSLPSSSSHPAGQDSVSPPRFRATPYAAESKTATRDEAVLLRSLLALIGKHCPSEFDKYQVLEERDKLLSKLREEENKHSDEKSRKVQGLCLGMCTEKERYVRVVQKRISPYECGPSGLDPNRLVKEYARSAADQDNPLPHELRSKELLKNTMDYLLKHVLDDVPGNDDDLATWYDFLWSRTRAIRKEITQLMLTDSTAVSLFESYDLFYVTFQYFTDFYAPKAGLCARIHILCAYKLCHLGFDRFDQNMNTENLAKCLQSLRHLYEDLEMQGETFNTEAEFRGYDVMLHLHDSNIMRQVLSYRKEVRESKPVRLALQLSSALQNKNYVRFFRLLRNEATFLQCCICHRYFNTVLSNALHTMMTAYGIRSEFLLDTAYLLRVLAWDDREDAFNSLALYRVYPNSVDHDQVLFNRDVFVQDPDAPARPYLWIDAKNHAAWSQVVYGPEPFAFFSIATITDSFDDSNRYNKDPVLSAVFEKYSLQSEAQRLMFAEQDPAPMKPASIAHMREEHREARSWVSSTVENVVREVADRESFTICRDVNVEELVSSISSDLVDEFIRELLMDSLNEERRERERERARLKSEKLKEEKIKVVRQLLEQLLDEVIAEKAKAAIREELGEGIRVHIETTAQNLIDELWRSKLWHAVDKETKAVLKKTLKSESDEISLGLQRFRDQMELLWLRQFWDVWRARVLDNRRKRQERRHDWETFQGVWNCQMFAPSNYAKRNEPVHRSSPSLALVDSQRLRISLKLVQFKKARSKRLMRKYFDKWRNYVEVRHTLQSMAKRMLHRPKIISSAQRSPFRPSYADRARRKRPHSPSFTMLDYSLPDHGPLYDSYRSSYDSQLANPKETSELPSSEYDYRSMFLSDSYFEEFHRYSPSEISKPFRPPSPRPEEYFGKQGESGMNASTEYDRNPESLILKDSTNSDAVEAVEGNKCEDETDAVKPSKQEDLFCEASSLHEKMLMFSKELNALIKRRKRTDDECRQTALEISVSP